jgi:hypothetical protein
MAALMVKSALNRPSNDVFLVGCQHIDLSQPDVRDVVTNIYDLSGAIAHDIAGTGTERAHAQTIDDQTDSDAASQVAILPNYHSKRDDIAAIADYVARKREAVDETESRAARILHGLIRNERLG